MGSNRCPPEVKSCALPTRRDESRRSRIIIIIIIIKEEEEEEEEEEEKEEEKGGGGGEVEKVDQTENDTHSYEDIWRISFRWMHSSVLPP